MSKSEIDEKIKSLELELEKLTNMYGRPFNDATRAVIICLKIQELERLLNE